MGIVIVASGAFLIVLDRGYGISIAKPLIALAAVLVFMISAYYVHARVPPYVVMKESYMYRGLNDETAEEWKYEDIVRCRFVPAGVEGNSSGAMELETTAGDRSRILVGREVPVAALKAFLLSRGIKEE